MYVALSNGVISIMPYPQGSGNLWEGDTRNKRAGGCRGVLQKKKKSYGHYTYKYIVVVNICIRFGPLKISSCMGYGP